MKTPAETYQELLEELHHEQDKLRAKELRKAIVMNERAIPHLSGIPRMHAQKRIADAKAELELAELAMTLYVRQKRREKRAAKKAA